MLDAHIGVNLLPNNEYYSYFSVRLTLRRILMEVFFADRALAMFGLVLKPLVDVPDSVVAAR